VTRQLNELFTVKEVSKADARIRYSAVNSDELWGYGPCSMLWAESQVKPENSEINKPVVNDREGI
jgi:hypothetical protein